MKMADIGNFAICEQAQRNLEDLYSERNTTQDEGSRSQDEVSRSEQRVAKMFGEIAVAENTLSRIQDAASNISDGAIAVAVDLGTGNTGAAARDALTTAVRLANEEARQSQKLATLQRQLADEEWQLQSARNQLSIIERDISQAIHFLDANNCW